MSVPVVPSHASVPELGVHLVGDGVEAAVFAAGATGVELCLIDVAADGTVSERRHALTAVNYGVWSGHVSGVQPDQRYGFRASGPWDPSAGQRYNPAKFLLDPYARGIVGDLQDVPQTRAHVVTDDVDDPYGEADSRDDVSFVPHGVVMGPLDHHATVDYPRVPWSQTVVYEAHVRGLTMTLPDVPENLRGTYAGLAHPATIAHLVSLGVTTVELLPIQAFADEPHLVADDLSNYWGYNTLGFFAPHAAYATAAARDAGPSAVRDEVRGMVHLLHEAGLEVVLDVVYNHTAEGGLGGAHVSWRGLDNRRYYLDNEGTPLGYADVTGTGSSLDFRRSNVIKMTLDSLRYWVTEIGVDGFRFDLAVTLARGEAGFSAFHPFLVALQTDPVLRNAKLIAEPWDIGPGGWCTGQFPPPFAEWNDRFRDTIRRFWLSDLRAASHGDRQGGVRELATRLSGSADLFGMSDPPLVRGPVASINFVSAHDGFTLADLTSYDHKHNFDNGEDNRDGTDNNNSWNHGLEGPPPTDDAGMDVAFLRRRSMRNLLGMLLLGAGTPMLTAGDEIGRTQRGNNNAYCQDNEISWLDWELAPWQEDLLATTRYLLGLRREHQALRVDNFFLGRPLPTDGTGQPDLSWFDREGTGVDHDQWHDDSLRVLQMLRRGGGDHEAHVLLVINGELDSVDVALAGEGMTTRTWNLVWDSSWESPSELEDLAGDNGADGEVRGGDQPEGLDTPVRLITPGTEVNCDAFSVQVYIAPSAQRAEHR